MNLMTKSFEKTHKLVFQLFDDIMIYILTIETQDCAN